MQASGYQEENWESLSLLSDITVVLMGINIPKIDVRSGGTLGFAAAVVGGGVKHLRKRSRDVSSSAELDLCLPIAFFLSRAKH